MPHDITGPGYFDNFEIGHQSQNRDGLMETDKRAVLYVFNPHDHQFQDVAMRPFQCGFDDNFLSATSEIADLANRGSASASSVVRDLRSRTNLNDYMMPSWDTKMLFKASNLNGVYRFILILTDTASSMLNGNTVSHSRSNNQVRRIYSGFFQEEPFNPTTFSDTRRTLNPAAIMTITHKTVLGVAAESGPYGMRQRLNTQSSDEILQPAFSKNLTAMLDNSQDRSLHVMTPDNCMDSIEMSEDNDGYSMAAYGLHSSMDTAADFLSDKLEQPAHYVGHIVQGLIRHQDEITQYNELPQYKGERMFGESFMDDSQQRVNLARSMQMPRPRNLSIMDLDIQKPYSVVDIDALVNYQLEVLDFDLDRPQYYETADQMINDITNQYSSLIAMVIIPILNSAGLNSLVFRYQIANRGGYPENDFYIRTAEPNMVMSNNELMMKVKAVQTELENGIFDTIFRSKGDFSVIVSAYATGKTSVRLSLIGMGYKNTADFEIPSCLGGLISPLIGNATHQQNNTQEIESLFGAATGTPSVTAKFNDDDRDFQEFAKGRSLDWGGATAELDYD